MKSIITESITINNICGSDSNPGAFKGDWSASSSDGAHEAVMAALEANGFELDRCGPCSGLFDERGCDAMSLEVGHGTVHFRPIKK